MAIAVVNTSVFCEQTKRTVLPWTICQLPEESHTFDDFFNEVVKYRLPSDCRLLSASIGPTKTSLDPVDTSLAVIPVINSFGRFLKYFVELCQDDSGRLLEGTRDSSVSSCSSILAFVTPVNVRNKKDQLYNDIISLFVSHNGLLEQDEVEPLGKELVKTLRDVLWYIDGHHYILAERAIPVPGLFQSFSSYNVPHLSKHRRRRTVNICSDNLNGFAQDLCTILHHSYWDRPHWRELKLPVTQLCESIASYVDYLAMKNKRAKQNHRSPTPVRELGSNIRLKLLPVAETDIPISLQPIDNAICGNSAYSYVPLMDYLPDEVVKKHRFIGLLESTGLSQPCILLIYLPGGNVGNMHFIWKVQDKLEASECFEQSQVVIESIKKSIPTYHTRAMRTSMFRKFGRVSASVKPAVLRYFYRDLTGMFK